MPRGKATNARKKGSTGTTRKRSATSGTKASATGLGQPMASDSKRTSVATLNKQIRQLPQQQQFKVAMTTLANAIAYGKANPATS